MRKNGTGVLKRLDLTKIIHIDGGKKTRAMETDYTGYISYDNDLSLMRIIMRMALGNFLHFSVYHDPDYCENTLAFTVFGEHGDIERFYNNILNDVNLSNIIKTHKEFQLDFLLQKTDPAKIIPIDGGKSRRKKNTND